MADSFAPVAVTPDRIGPLEIVFRVQAGTPNVYEGRYTFDVLDADGTIVDVRRGDLVPHMTAQQVTSIKGFLDTMLTKAQGAIG